MVNDQELGELIRESRLKIGMSLGQLASAVGRSSSSVRRWERGEVAPAVTVLPKLAEVLGIDASELESARTGRTVDAETPENGDSAAQENEEESSDVRVVTIEQPAALTSEETEPEPQAAMVQADRSDGGMFADAWRVLTVGRQSWIGWVRGVLTAGTLLVMLLVLVWAAGELFDAFGTILDSFEVGSVGNG